MANSADLVFNLIGKDNTGPAFKSAAGHADGTRGALDKVGLSMGKLAKLAGGLAIGAGLVAGAKAAAGFAAEATMLASDLAEVRTANEQVFGATAAAELRRWSATAATSLGQTKTQALDAARTFGVFGKAAGLSGTDLSGFSMELTTLATDMASFNNTSPEEAIEAIGAALRGESEPMRRFGVLLDDATLKARAMEMGIYDGSGALTQQQKVLAAHQEILAQTADQQGDFGRTSGGMANQMRTIQALWQDTKTAAGEALLPVAEKILPKVTSAMTDLLAKVEENMPAAQAYLESMADKVIEKFPQVQAWLSQAAAGVSREWPDIKDTISTVGDALERVGGMAESMWSAFKSLPPQAQQILSLLAVAKTTGVLSVAFKATDLVKSLFANVVNVIGGSVTGGGGVPGTAGRLGAAATVAVPVAATAAGAVALKAAVDPMIDALHEATSAMNVYQSALEQAARESRESTKNWGGVTQAIRDANDEGTRFGQAMAAAAVQSGHVGHYAQTAARRVAEIGAEGQWTEKQIAAIRTAVATIEPGDGIAEIEMRLATIGHEAGLSQQQIALLMPALFGIDAGPVRDLWQSMESASAAAQLTTEQTGFMRAALAAMPPTTPINILEGAIRAAGREAGLTEEQMLGLIAAAHGIPVPVTLPGLEQAIASAGQAAGLTSSEVFTMIDAALLIPQGANADVLASALRKAGLEAGLSEDAIQQLIAAAWAVPSTANLPALQSGLRIAGQAADLTEDQVRVMSAAVWAIPRGATAEQAGEAIRAAGQKAGLTREQVDKVTAALNSIPPTKFSTITTNAVTEKSKVDDLSWSIKQLYGKDITIGVGIRGSTGGGPAGGGAVGTTKPWLDRQIDDLVNAMVPKLMQSGAIGSGPWRRPMASYVVSSEWMRGGTGVHYGIDMAAGMGTPIFAASGGRVMQAFYSNVGYGTMATVDHGAGLSTLYSHMSSLAVSPGQLVGAGQLIGLVGSTGDSTGPHLHFETKINGRAVEPRGFMAARGVALATGGMVPVNVSAGEYFMPQSKAKNNYSILQAINAGVINGPGGPTSDSVAGVAAPGDFVVNAAATRRNRGLLDRIRSGSQYLADGGVVGAAAGGRSAVFGATGPQSVELHISGRVLYGALSDYRRESGRAVLEFA